MREAMPTEKPLLRSASWILSTHVVVDWRDLDGLILVVATVIDGCGGSVKGNPPKSLGEVETRLHVASVGQ